jgi:hypothetical protein
VTTHPLDPDDAAVMTALRAMVVPTKGMARGIDAREPSTPSWSACSRATM